MPDTVHSTLRRTLTTLEADRERVDRQIAALRTALAALGGGASHASRSAGAPRRRRKPMSAAARRAVAKRMKAYWAKRKMQGAKTAARTSK